MSNEVTPNERPRIDTFVIADRAEAINGKLYVMGAGFDTVGVPTLPFSPMVWFGAILRVPWNDTNRRLQIQGVVETSDGEELNWRLDGEIEAGRPPGKRGGDVPVVLAGPIQFPVEEETDVVVKLRFAQDERSVPLRIVSVTTQLPQPPH